MAKIQIDGIGTIEVDDSFKDLSPEQQQAFIDNVKSQVAEGKTSSATTDTVTDKVADAAVSTAGYVGSKAIDLGTGTVADLLTNLPGLVKDMSEGKVLSASFRVITPIIGNTLETGVEIVFDGVGFALKVAGKEVWEGATSEELHRTITDLARTGFDKSTTAIKETLDKANIEDLTEVDITLLQKLAMATSKEAALGFFDEMTLGLGRLVAEHGFGVEAFKKAEESNPDAYKVGSNAGFVIGLAGGPLAAAKTIGKGARAILKSSFSNIAIRGNLKKVSRDFDELKKQLGNVREQFKKSLPAADKEVLKKLDSSMAKDVKAIRGKLEGLYQLKYASGKSRRDLRNWWIEGINELPSGSFLKQYPDIGEHIFDRMLKTKKAPDTDWFRYNVGNVVKENLKNIALNWPRYTSELIAEFSADSVANYMIALSEAEKQGMSGEKAHAQALKFTIYRMPEELLLDFYGKVVEGSFPGFVLEALARVGVAGYRAEDGTIDFSKRSILFGKDKEEPKETTSYNPEPYYGTLSGIAEAYGHEPYKNRGGIMKRRMPYVKRKGIMRY